MHSESGFRSFPTTRWSLVGRAAETDAEARRTALDALLRLYLPALRAHLRIARRFRAVDADDLLQGFVADKVMESGIIGRADVARGRFRSYLLVALDRYVVSQARRERAAKRGRGTAETDGPEAGEAVAADGEPSDAFETAWARELVAEAKRRMEASCREAGRDDVWCVFARHVAPTQGGADGERLTGSIADRKKQANLLVTAKRAFRRAIRSVIADYVENDEQVDEEICDLKRALVRAGA
jgi:RNA polymerase sigma-70 factor (ECF subfamily)